VKLPFWSHAVCNLYHYIAGAIIVVTASMLSVSVARDRAGDTQYFATQDALAKGRDASMRCVADSLNAMTDRRLASRLGEDCAAMYPPTQASVTQAASSTRASTQQ
jgi:hypothetical protein